MRLGSISTWPSGEATMSVTDIAAIEAAICEVRDLMEENLCPILGFLVGLLRVDCCLYVESENVQREWIIFNLSSRAAMSSPAFFSALPWLTRLPALLSILLSPENWTQFKCFLCTGFNVSQFVCIANDPSNLISWCIKKFVLPTSNAHASVAHRTPAAKNLFDHIFLNFGSLSCQM